MRFLVIGLDFGFDEGVVPTTLGLEIVCFLGRLVVINTPVNTTAARIARNPFNGESVLTVTERFLQTPDWQMVDFCAGWILGLMKG